MAGPRQIPEDFHALYDAGARAARGVPLGAGPARTTGHGRLSAAVPGLLVDYDEATGLPNRIAVERPEGRLTSLVAASPAEAAASFVRERGDLWELTDSDAEGVEVVSVSRRGMPTVQFVQRANGVEVFSSEVTAAVGGDNQVVALAGQFFPGASAVSRQRSAGPVTTAEEAIARAALDLTGVNYDAAEFIATGEDDRPYRFYAAPESDGRPAFERPVRVKDVLFPLGDGQLSPGYYLELWIKDFPAFSYVIDSVDDPDVLFRKNLSSESTFKYKVFNTGDSLLRPEDGPAPGTPHPTGIPDGFQAPTIPERVIDTGGLLKGDPWLPDGATTTQGNNCFAYADLAAPQGFGAGDVVGKASAPGCFEYTYDHTKAASGPNNLQSSLAGMFVHVNWLHDRWYEAGFDEAAGNAQQDNFGRGGSGGDPILAEGHDFSGTDNANMSTPADGASPRMQMYEFVGVSPLPSRTSNFDALITFHEMGHYVTNRLVGNASGLSNQQGRAMGEGWGDFFAICMTSQSTDNFANGVFAVGGWTDVTPTFKDNYYFSIRRYPYTADMGKNPLTFKHISANVVLPSGPPSNPNGGGPNNEVHNAGEIWCATLWEVFVNLVAKHGHAEAERRMLEYVIGGLKLTPSRPTFTQARDGILSAVAALNAGDLPEVWQGFAKRGMGTAAVSAPSSSTSLAGVVESFDVP